jgi:antitoxin CptB
MTGSTRSSDGLDPRRRRLLFRAWHRGIREMDLILGRFADAHLATLSEAELNDYERIMDVPDQQLFGWITGVLPTPVDQDSPLLRRLRDFHHRASDRP